MRCPVELRDGRKCGSDVYVTRKIEIPPGKGGYYRDWRRMKCVKGHNFRTVTTVTEMFWKDLMPRISVVGVVGGEAEGEMVSGRTKKV